MADALAVARVCDPAGAGLRCAQRMIFTPPFIALTHNHDTQMPGRRPGLQIASMPMKTLLFRLLPFLLTACYVSADQSTYRSTLLSLGPKGYWQFDEASGTTATDSSTAGHPGTYTGVTLAQPGAFGASSKAIQLGSAK